MADFDGVGKVSEDHSFSSEKQKGLFENGVEVLRDTKKGEIDMIQEMDKTKSAAGLEESGQLLDTLNAANPGVNSSEVFSNLTQELDELVSIYSESTRPSDSSFRDTVKMFENLESSNQVQSPRTPETADFQQAREAFFGVMLAGISANLNDVKRETGSDKDLFAKRVIGGVAKGYEISADLATKYPTYYKDMLEKVDFNRPFDRSYQYSRSKSFQEKVGKFVSTVKNMPPNYASATQNSTPLNSSQIENIFQMIKMSDFGKRG